MNARDITVFCTGVAAAGCVYCVYKYATSSNSTDETRVLMQLSNQSLNQTDVENDGASLDAVSMADVGQSPSYTRDAVPTADVEQSPSYSRDAVSTADVEQFPSYSRDAVPTADVEQSPSYSRGDPDQTKVKTPVSCESLNQSDPDQTKVKTPVSCQSLNQTDVENDGAGLGSDVVTDAVPTTDIEQPPPYSRGSFELDAVILYAEEDEFQAKECHRKLSHLANIGFTEDVIIAGTYTILGLSELLLKCRLVIIFHTKKFKADPLLDYAKHINLRQSVEDDEKRHRIIPMLADDEKLSRDLCALEPVCYDDTFLCNKMSKLFDFWKEKLP